jgi:hypothetical protein
MMRSPQAIFQGALTLLVLTGVAQNPEIPYFQQEVNYTITVTLHDTLKTLSAREEIAYRNNAPQPLQFIYFHLWPNAYKDRTTALAKQLLSHGETRLHHAKEKQRGYIDSLDFAVDGKKVKWEYDPEHIDICKLYLDKPLEPGATALITTPFRVKLPAAVFSRMGYMTDAVSVTQWYPKPAVYDNRGWHQMPYLDQGEFYSEFGSFDVSITLPSDYVLAATGDRVAGSEDKFLEKKIAETRRMLSLPGEPPDSLSAPARRDHNKTVRFIQTRVHDFAWFADRDFLVLKDQVTLPESGRKVDTWIFFTPQNAKYWKDALSYLNAATLFYSKHIGEYPYKHVTALDGTIMAGGGMEYPNITIIGNAGSAIDLDLVITHEVGHNWFYGILGSNERRYPFLDEGINSFYEMRYVRERYPDEKLTRFLRLDPSFPLFGLSRVPYWKMHEVLYYFSMRMRADQPLDLHSTDYSSFNYGSVVYSKTPMVLDHLMGSMGEARFDSAMHAYFNEWKFRHPYPEDFYKSISSSSATDLTGFRRHLFTSTDHIDYKLSNVKKKDGIYVLKVRNVSGAVLPLSITATDAKGNAVATQWFEGFKGKNKLEMRVADAERFTIDHEERTADINRKNNSMLAKGLFRKAEPLQVNLLTSLEDPHFTELNVLPMLGGNYYNGFLTGLALHNYGVYQKKFEFAVVPMWGWKSETVAGYAEADYKFHFDGLIRHVAIGTKAKSFAYNEVRVRDYLNFARPMNEWLLHYYKIAPFLKFDLKSKATSPYSHAVVLRSNFLFTDSVDARKLTSDPWPETHNVSSYVNEADYLLSKKSPLHAWSLRLSMQQNDRMAKLWATWRMNLHLSRRHMMEIRGFAGTFLSGDDGARTYYAFRAAGYNGSQDYLFDHNFVARNLDHGFGFSQFAEEDGALKVPTPYGQSGTWLAAINVKSPKLGFVPARLYADVALTEKQYLYPGESALYAFGVNFHILKDVVDIYLPVYHTEGITLPYASKWYEKIRFTINIHKLAPRELVQNNVL